MDYAETRDALQLQLLDAATDDFIKRYLARPGQQGRRTVFLFPGGMGCQLMRTREEYDPALAPGDYQLDTVWLNAETFLSGVLQIRMRKDGAGVFREADDHIIAGNGAVELFGFTPYSGFAQWCDQHSLDWFVFGWDWRRRLGDSVTFFRQAFLPRFQQRVKAACGGADPLADYVILGHSFGGMVVNLLLREPTDPVVPDPSLAITVASPFYGFAGQLHRWFEGESYFEVLHSRRAIVEVISSLPAGYTLLFLDQDTWEANKAGLQSDPLYPLTDYPNRDATTGNIADPYDPQTNGQLRRYPDGTGFDPDELAYAKGVVQTLARSLPDALAARFYNIRGVQTGQTTYGSTTSEWIDPDFDPSRDPSPIINDPQVPGDDTLPAWTTRLLGLPPRHCMTVTGDVEHMFMMDDANVQAHLAEILIGHPEAPERQPGLLAAEPMASAVSARELLGQVYENSLTGGTVGDLLRQSSPALMRQVGRRILKDVMKRPH